jgi:hypothetical protein
MKNFKINLNDFEQLKALNFLMFSSVNSSKPDKLEKLNKQQIKKTKELNFIKNEIRNREIKKFKKNVVENISYSDVNYFELENKIELSDNHVPKIFIFGTFNSITQNQIFDKIIKQFNLRQIDVNNIKKNVLFEIHDYDKMKKKMENVMCKIQNSQFDFILSGPVCHKYVKSDDKHILNKINSTTFFRGIYCKQPSLTLIEKYISEFCDFWMQQNYVKCA